MKKEYDKDIDSHYMTVAKQDGLSSTSTMADQKTRDIETNAICDFVALAIKEKDSVCTIADIGCGNGYTLEVLSEKFPDQKFIGVEKNDGLRELAQQRFSDRNNVDVIEGDIRDNDFIGKQKVDVLICQRVIINLLEESDQKLALDNIVNSVVDNGKLLFIECFQSSLDLLNEARDEFDMLAIPPAHHNLYLNDDFFVCDAIQSVYENELKSNFLSTHYFVTRVLDAHYKRDKEFKRNSQLVSFLTEALNQNVGDYSPLKLFCFKKA